MIPRKLPVVSLTIGIAFLSGQAYSAVNGPCENCHTMHNTQNNSPIVAGAPLDYLLSADCITCHTGQNTGATDVVPFDPPYVWNDTGTVTYSADGTGSNSLAGGNFYWMESAADPSIGDRLGHNVSGIVGADALLGLLPPGNSTPMASQLECAGANGCHGDRTEPSQIVAVSGGHHNNNHSVWKDGTSMVMSYRFLNGIQGFGDEKYEYQPAVSRHNKYYGVDRTGETLNNTATISSFCSSCHPNYHHGSNPTLLPAGSSSFVSGGVWIRHPTDYDMSNATSSTDFTTYNGGTGSDNPYSLVVPLATATQNVTVQTTVYSVADDAVVMCLSCHRAHGSPNNAMLRWNYKGWPDTGGEDGCQICHTSKD